MVFKRINGVSATDSPRLLLYRRSGGGGAFLTSFPVFSAELVSPRVELRPKNMTSLRSTIKRPLSA